MSVRIIDKDAGNLAVNTIDMCDQYIFEFMLAQETIKKFTETENLKGQTGHNVKMYFLEVHIDLINKIMTYLEDFKLKLSKYVKALSQLDENINSAIDTDVLGNCISDFNTIHTEFAELGVTRREIFSSVSDLMDLDSLYADVNGSNLYNAAYQKMTDIKTNVYSLGSDLEELDSNEISIVDTLAEFRTTITNLIAEIAEKEDYVVSHYQIGDLAKMENYDECSQATTESLEYIESVKDEGLEEFVMEEAREHTKKTVGLYLGAGGNLVDSVLGVKDGVTIVGAGIALTAANPVLGPCVIAVGVGQIYCSVVDGIRGTIGYTEAIINDDVYYHYDTVMDESIINPLIETVGEYGKLPNTVVTTVTDALVTYKETDNATWTIAYTTYNLAGDQLWIPLATEIYDMVYTEVNGESMDEHHKETVERVIEKVYKSPADWLGKTLRIL
ncbi:MAG: hypothetical protein IJO70_07020 [Lachnospiraceae bacterium]|nr:hypothetical protein [Lachnospiraceae bacterium]